MSNNISKWTIDMDSNVLYGTNGFPEQEGLTMELLEAHIHTPIMEQIDITPVQRVIKLTEELMVSSILKNGTNEVIFCKMEQPSVWNYVKEQALRKMGS